jgi:hypothetical protein
MRGTGKRRRRGFYGLLDQAEAYLELLWNGPDSKLHSLWTQRAKYLGQVGSAQRMLRTQSWLILASYICGFLGVLLSIHDYHHYDTDRFGPSTPFLGAAILLYLLGNQRPRKR